MAFPCCGCARKIGCRIFGSIDIFLSIMSFYQWMRLFTESTRVKGDDWDQFLHRGPRAGRASVAVRCGDDYLDIHKPSDLGTHLMKVVVFFSLASLGYLVTALFLIYATISAPDMARVLLAVFSFCQILLMALSISAAVMFQDPVLCFYQHDGIPGHETRQAAFLTLTFIFVFGYKLYELLLIGFYIRELRRVAPQNDPEVLKMCPATIRGARMATPPKQSKHNSLELLDLNMNYALIPGVGVINVVHTEATKRADAATNGNATTTFGTDKAVVVDENQNIAVNCRPSEYEVPGIPFFYSPHIGHTEY